MSVLHLTFSSIHSIQYLDSVLEAFSLPRKKILFNIGVLCFLLLMTGYLYIAGQIVAKDNERERLTKELARNVSILQKAESAAIEKEKTLLIEFFLVKGYKEPDNLSVIKRERNVAQSIEKLFY